MIRVYHGGTTTTLEPTTGSDERWLRENCEGSSWQWLGGALTIDPRYVSPILEAARAEGLEVVDA